ncbi:hypothetical protein S83_043557, partial [Arachis hypogaea]
MCTVAAVTRKHSLLMGGSLNFLPELEYTEDMELDTVHTAKRVKITLGAEIPIPSLPATHPPPHHARRHLCS